MSLGKIIRFKHTKFYETQDWGRHIILATVCKPGEPLFVVIVFGFITEVQIFILPL